MVEFPPEYQPFPKNELALAAFDVLDSSPILNSVAASLVPDDIGICRVRTARHLWRANIDRMSM